MASAVDATGGWAGPLAEWHGSAKTFVGRSMTIQAPPADER